MPLYPESGNRAALALHQSATNPISPWVLVERGRWIHFRRDTRRGWNETANRDGTGSPRGQKRKPRARHRPHKEKRPRGLSELFVTPHLPTGGARGDNRNPRGMDAPARKEKNRRAPDFVSSSAIPPADPSSEFAFGFWRISLARTNFVKRTLLNVCFCGRYWG